MSEPYQAYKPLKGQQVKYRGEVAGTVQAVEGNLCWVDYLTGTNPFIWRFREGLNSLHDWPTKSNPREEYL